VSCTTVRTELLGSIDAVSAGLVEDISEPAATSITLKVDAWRTPTPAGTSRSNGTTCAAIAAIAAPERPRLRSWRARISPPSRALPSVQRPSVRTPSSTLRPAIRAPTRSVSP
jgi:hypothetical protein